MSKKEKVSDCEKVEIEQAAQAYAERLVELYYDKGKSKLSNEGLSLEIGDMRVVFEKDDMYERCRFGLVIENDPPELWAEKDGEPIQAFVTDVDGDWYAVNGFELSEYEEEIIEFAEQVEENVREMFISSIMYHVDDCDIRVVNADGVELQGESLVKYITWQETRVYEYYKDTMIANENRSPQMQLLCESPVRASYYKLVLENCNVFVSV